MTLVPSLHATVCSSVAGFKYCKLSVGSILRLPEPGPTTTTVDPLSLVNFVDEDEDELLLLSLDLFNVCDLVTPNSKVVFNEAFTGV